MIKKYVSPSGAKQPYLYRNQRTGVFYAVASRHGRTIKISLETKDYQTAKVKVLEALSRSQVRPKERSNRLIFEFFHDLIQSQEADGTRESTMTRMVSVWKNSLKEFWGDLSPIDVNDQTVTQWIVWHKKTKPKIQLYNAVKYLRLLFRLMNQRGAIQRVPVIRVPKDERAHHMRQKGTIITEEEFHSIMSHLDLRHRIIARIAWETGMRKMEIGKLKWEDVSPDLMITIREENSKVKRKRVVPIGEWFNEIMREKPSEFIFKSRDGHHLVSQAIDRAWTKAKRKAGIDRAMRFHDLRHTAASRMAKVMSPVVACKILGMSFSTFQKTYLHMSDQDMKSEMLKLASLNMD